jgi:hypothetical protein
VRRPINSSTATRWSTYPRNVTSLFEGEDLENYNDFFTTHTQQLFDPSKIELTLKTARDHIDQSDHSVNGNIHSNATSEPDKAVDSKAKQAMNYRSITSEDVIDTNGFDAALEVSEQGDVRRSKSLSAERFAQRHLAPDEDHFM